MGKGEGLRPRVALSRIPSSPPVVPRRLPQLRLPSGSVSLELLPVGSGLPRSALLAPHTTRRCAR